MNLMTGFRRKSSCHTISKVISRICSTESESKVTQLFQIFSENRSQQYFKSINGMIERKKLGFDPYLSIKNSSIDLVSYFLPKGFPQSVSPGYKSYVFLQFFGNIFSSVGGVLSIQSLLLAMGLSSNVLPAASTLNWVIKDGIGQFGGVLFASAVSNRFDADPKRWRFVASVSLDASSFIELLTPLAPQYFLLLASIGNIGKNISYLAASASRAALHKSFAIHENLADITAKSGSQTILSSMLGTGLGITIATVLNQDFNSILFAYMCCSTIHLSATYLSLKYVTLNTLNLHRLIYLYEHFEKTNILLSPTELVKKENYFSVPNLQTAQVLPRVHIGTDLDLALESFRDYEVVRDEFADDKYMIITRACATRKIGEIHLLIKANANTNDLVEGILLSYFTSKLLAQSQYVPMSSTEELYRNIKNNFPGFYSMSQQSHQSQAVLPLQNQFTKYAKSLLLAQSSPPIIGDSSIIGENRQDRSTPKIREFILQSMNSEWHSEALLLETRIARIFDEKNAMTAFDK